jgi:hypothetical protein
MKVLAYSLIRILCLFFLINAPLKAQVKASSDSIFILYDSQLNKAMESGKRAYFKPELRYPNDVGRVFYIKQYQYCAKCKPPKWETKPTFPYTFIYDPIDNFFTYTELSPNEFSDKLVFDQNWFNNTHYQSIIDLLSAAKNIFLVDSNWLRNGKYIMLRVKYQPDIEID